MGQNDRFGALADIMIARNSIVPHSRLIVPSPMLLWPMKAPSNFASDLSNNGFSAGFSCDIADCGRLMCQFEFVLLSLGVKLG